jgi:hypothetical protein
MNNPKVIYLEPLAALNPNYDRTWCDHDAYEGEGVKYVLSEQLEQVKTVIVDYTSGKIISSDNSKVAVERIASILKVRS